MTDTANAPERILMPERVRLDPDYPGWQDQVIGWADGNDVQDMQDWPVYVSEAHCDELVAAAYVAASEKSWAIAVEMELHAAIGSTTKAKAEAIEGAILSGTPDNARAALTAYGERMKAEGFTAGLKAAEQNRSES